MKPHKQRTLPDPQAAKPEAPRLTQPEAASSGFNLRFPYHGNLKTVPKQDPVNPNPLEVDSLLANGQALGKARQFRNLGFGVFSRFFEEFRVFGFDDFLEGCSL